MVAEPTGHLVHWAKIVQEGAGFVERDGGNLIAGADEWFAPVEAKTGPDGNVWVADWYNFIVQHNPTPSRDHGGYDAENGPGNAYINPPYTTMFPIPKGIDVSIPRIMVVMMPKMVRGMLTSIPFGIGNMVVYGGLCQRIKKRENHHN